MSDYDTLKCPRDNCNGNLGLDRETNELVCSACERRFDPSVYKLPMKPKAKKQTSPEAPPTTPETGTSPMLKDSRSLEIASGEGVYSAVADGNDTFKAKINKGGNMPGVNASELHPETLEKLGADVPPKPDTTGMSQGKKIHVLAKYYEDNKEAILSDIEIFGEDTTVRKWGMSANGWLYRRAKWFPDKYSLPTWQTPEHKAQLKLQREKKEPKVDKKNIPEAKRSTVQDFDPVNHAYLEVKLAYYMGYHACTQDFLRSGVIK